MNTITMNFPNEQAKEDFLAWWLDGGGDQDYQQSLELSGGLMVVTSNWTKNTITLSLDEEYNNA